MQPINMHPTTLHLCLPPLYIPPQHRCHWRTVPQKKEKEKVLHFNGLFFYAKRNNRVFRVVPAEPSVERQPFSHPLSLVVTWRTLAVLGFCLILVSGGRTHPFFMVYMHTTTDSKELAPVPKMRFAFAQVSRARFLITLCNISSAVLQWSIPHCAYSAFCVLCW